MPNHRTAKNRVDAALGEASRLSRKVRTRAYKLTAELLSEYGGSVVCIDERAIDKHYRLYAKRPDASLNRPIFRSEIEANVVDSNGNMFDVSDLAEPTPKLIRVDISGPIEQRAGFHDCEAWSDGHDAIEERLIAAMQTSDVLLVIDSPGGAHAGLQERIRNVVREKAVYGRRVTVFADEMIGSAAYWWAACVGDEIYGPEAALIGSIGARAGHQSIAGALAREGIDTTYFVWPGPGKVAFAPEMPLSDLGKQRGNRDVAAAGEAFAAAVGPRRGLTRDEIVDLDADVLTGFAAVRGKLSDGVASYDEVLAYALALAESGTMSKIRTEGDPSDPKTPEELRAEEPQKPGHPEPDGDEPEPGTAAGEPDGDEPDSDEPKKAFCAYCGNKLEGDPKPEDEGDKPNEDKPEPEQNARAASAVASVFGLSANASVPSVKAAAIAYASLGAAVMTATGTKSPREAIGALKTLVDEASEVASLRADLKSMRKAASFRERMDLLTKLASAGIPGYTRGELIVDKEVDGKLVSGPSALYAKTDLETLRGFVESKLKSGTPRVKANPFEPSRKNAEAGKLVARTNNIIEQHPGFIQGAAVNSTATPEKLAQSAAALESAGMFQS
jgi:ClpP class serine protease